MDWVVMSDVSSLGEGICIHPAMQRKILSMIRERVHVIFTEILDFIRLFIIIWALYKKIYTIFHKGKSCINY
jgi:hypothetical protein